MEHYAGIDVSLESASVCVVEAGGRIVREAKVASEPDALIAWFGKLAVKVSRIGLEAGPLSQWLYAGMREAGLPVELLETRHVRDAFKAMPVKTDRNDARGIDQRQRCGRHGCAGTPATPERAGGDAGPCIWQPWTGRCRYPASAARHGCVAHPRAGCRDLSSGSDRGYRPGPQADRHDDVTSSARYRRKPLRCQRTSVSGLKMIAAPSSDGNSW